MKRSLRILFHGRRQTEYQQCHSPSGFILFPLPVPCGEESWMLIAEPMVVLTEAGFDGLLEKGCNL